MPVATVAQASTSSWVQVGSVTGPMLLQATSGAIILACAAGIPGATAPGFSLKPGEVFAYTGAQNVYMRARPAVGMGGVEAGGLVVYSV